MIYNEDCLDTINRNISYDYVLTSPPDFEEIGFNPSDIDSYKTFLKQRIGDLKPKNDIITIFISNRKYKGGTIEKDRLVSEVMEESGWQLYSKKVWIKKYTMDLFRYGYTNILTYRKNKAKIKNLPDCFYDKFKRASKFYTYNFSEDIIKQFIESCTEETQTVFDPFIGCGTTYNVCKQLNRKCIGSEIDTNTYNEFLKNFNI